MEEWKECKLGDICKSNIYSYSEKDNWAFVNYLDTGNITENKISDIQFIDLSSESLPSRARRKVQINDIIYSTVRPNQKHFGIIKNQPENFLVSTGFAVLHINKTIADPNFVFYNLIQNENTETLHAIAEQTTSAYPAIKPSDIENLSIKLPPLPTQQKIAAILSSLDDKIELNNKINTNLEQQAGALFKNWFVDFEPVGGKMPEEWKVGKLSDIAEITSGKRPPMKQSNYSKDVSIPLVGAASVMGYTNQVLYNEPILITGRVGTHGVIQRFSTECWPSDNTLVIKSKYYEYVYQIMSNIDYDNMNRGSTQPLITQSDLGKVECIIPDEDNLQKFKQLVNILFSKVQENQQENQKLVNIRDTLLPKLVNGEIEV